MIVRKIKAHELKRTNELFSLAFGFASSDERTAEEVYLQVSSQPKSREELCWQEHWAAFEDDDRTMMSFFVAKPMPIHFDGNHCIMTGIGGVSTLPQYRRQGCIRACFQAALPDMHENGVAFSYLYPFSTAYYRKFGYEICCERIRYHLRLSFIPAFTVSGNCVLCEPGHPYLEDIRKIYSAFQNRYNMMVENEEFEYQWVLQSNPVKDQVFTYIYKSSDGEPKAFMSFSVQNEAGHRNLVCSRFFYTDLEGLKGLLLLARSLESDHYEITFDLPTDQYIVPLLPEWSMDAGRQEKISHGMVRVINAVKVLEMAEYKGSGSLVLDISDPFIPQNNGRFLVSFENNRATAVTITDAPWDITLDIHIFSVLIAGVCDIRQMHFLEKIRINSSWDRLEKVFYPKPLYITESF